MKKNVLTLMGATISVFCMCLSACNKNKEESTETEVETLPYSVTVNGLYAFYSPSDKIDWDKVGLTLTFSDYSTLDLTRGEIDPSRRNYSPKEGEYSLVTSGLYKEDGSLSEGSYPVAYTYMYEGELYEGTYMVVVSSSPTSKYMVLDYENPNFENKYEGQLESVSSTSDESSEGNFYAAPAYFEVGADNPFIYKPSFTLLPLSGGATIDSSSSNYQVDYSVTKDGSAVGSDYVTYDGYFGFQFTEKAIGSSFTISMTPKFFTSDVSGNTLEAASITIKVCDGYNVYNALDLGRINLTSVPTSELSSYTNGYSEPIFFDSATKSLVSRAYSEIWSDYFTQLGVSDAKETNGIYLINDIVVTDNNIPSDYFVSKEEMDAIGNGNSDVVGSLRDYSRIYTHLLDTDFTLNGNLFSIDASSVSWGKTFYEEGMKTEDYYYDTNKTNFNPGHSNLFLFSGNSKTLTSSSFAATVKNIESTGNTRGILTAGTDEASIRNAEYASGSLIFCDSSSAPTIVENTIIKNYMIGYFSSDSVGETNCLDLEKSKIYDCYNSAVFIRESESNYIKSCDFARFGGPAIFLISNDLSTRDSEGNVTTRSFNRAGVTVNEDVTISAQLLGDEAWFTLVGATSMMSTISSMDAFFSGGNYPFSGDVNIKNLDLGDTMNAALQLLFPSGFISIDGIDVPCQSAGKTILDSDGKFNFKEIGLDYDYLSAVDEDIYTSYTIEHTDGTKTSINADMSYDSSQVELTEENQASFHEEDKLSYVISEYFKDGDHPSMAVFMTNTGKIIGLQVKISISTESTSLMDILNSLELEISLIDLWQWAYTGGEDGGQNIPITLDSSDTELFFYYRPPKMGVPFSGILELYDYEEE